MENALDTGKFNHPPTAHPVLVSYSMFVGLFSVILNLLKLAAPNTPPDTEYRCVVSTSCEYIVAITKHDRTNKIVFFINKILELLKRFTLLLCNKRNRSF